MSSELKVITNNVPRDIVEGYELTPEERKEFDYVDFAAIEAGNDSASFFRYQGRVYDLGEFMTTSGVEFPGRWDGYQSDSYFSGILVRYVDEFERVIVGRYLA